MAAVGQQPLRSGSSGAAAQDRYRWVALANTTAAVFMSQLDGSIVLIALPAIFRGIHLDPLAAGNISYPLWLIMGYRLPFPAQGPLDRGGPLSGRTFSWRLG